MKKTDFVDAILTLELSEHDGREGPGLALPERAAVIVFGHQLEPDGGMRPRLLQRLGVARDLAEANPQAPIVLTGGSLGAALTEAEAMANWLTESGVDPRRLHLETRAEDTVGNALYSMPILADLRVEHVRLVSSTYHIRRGLILLSAAAMRLDLDMRFDHLAAPDPALSTPRVGVGDTERALIAADLERILTMELDR